MSDPLPQTVKQLAELVAAGNCVLFLGNDLPLGYPGAAPPCRDEPAADLAHDLEQARATHLGGALHVKTSPKVS